MRQELAECKSLDSAEEATVCINNLLASILTQSNESCTNLDKVKQPLEQAFNQAEERLRAKIQEVTDGLSIKMQNNGAEMAKCVPS